MAVSWRDAQPPVLGPILSSALEVFNEHGFHGASVREIARRANLTVPSLYYHYASKEGLLRAVLTSSLEPIVERVEQAAAEGDDPPAKLANVVECIVLSVTSAATSAIDAAESRYLGPENHTLYVQVRDRLERPVQQILQDGAERGFFVIDDIPETRRAILGLTQAIPRWYQRDGSDSPTDIARRYARLVLRMVGYPVAVL